VFIHQAAKAMGEDDDQARKSWQVPPQPHNMLRPFLHMSSELISRSRVSQCMVRDMDFDSNVSLTINQYALIASSESL